MFELQNVRLQQKNARRDVQAQMSQSTKVVNYKEVNFNQIKELTCEEVDTKIQGLSKELRKLCGIQGAFLDKAELQISLAKYFFYCFSNSIPSDKARKNLYQKAITRGTNSIELLQTIVGGERTGEFLYNCYLFDQKNEHSRSYVLNAEADAYYGIDVFIFDTAKPDPELILVQIKNSSGDLDDNVYKKKFQAFINCKPQSFDSFVEKMSETNSELTNSAKKQLEQLIVNIPTIIVENPELNTGLIDRFVLDLIFGISGYDINNIIDKGEISIDLARRYWTLRNNGTLEDVFDKTISFIEDALGGECKASLDIRKRFTNMIQHIDNHIFIQEMKVKYLMTTGTYATEAVRTLSKTTVFAFNPQLKPLFNKLKQVAQV